MAAGAKGKVGIIGLGIMGGAFARNLIADGWVVTGVDPDEKKVLLSIAKDDVKDAPDYDEGRTPGDQHDEISGYFSSDKYRGLHGDPIGPTAGPGDPNDRSAGRGDPNRPTAGPG